MDSHINPCLDTTNPPELLLPEMRISLFSVNSWYSFITCSGTCTHPSFPIGDHPKTNFPPLAIWGMMLLKKFIKKRIEGYLLPELLGKRGINQAKNASSLLDCIQALPGPVNSTISPSPLNNVDFIPPIFFTL